MNIAVAEEDAVDVGGNTRGSSGTSHDEADGSHGSHGSQESDVTKSLRETRRLLNERVKELECVHGVSRLFDRKGATLDSTLQGVVELVPAAWQYPDAAEACIYLDDGVFRTEGFADESPWQHSSSIVVQGETVGKITVCYREERSSGDDELFLPEERLLLDTIGQRLSGYVERQRTLRSLLSYQQDLRELASALSLTEQHERRRIAEGLHDNIGQNLALVNMRLSAAQQSSDTREAAELIDEARELISEVIAETRTLTFELCPPILYELGLAAALDWLVEQAGDVYGYAAIVRQESKPLALPEDMAATIFQAVRELLNNAGRHGHSTRVSVKVFNEDEQLRLTVEDNGVGFDPAALQSRTAFHKGFGLFNIRERLRLLGGGLQLQSRPGEGTTVSLVVPRNGGVPKNAEAQP